MTSGVIAGIDVVIQKGTGPATTVVGQGEGNITFVQTPVLTTNKSSGNFIEYADGLTTSKGLTFAGSLIYNDDVDLEAIRAGAWDSTQDDYTILYGATGESYTGKFVPNGLSDTAPMDGNVVSSSVTFSSSGTVVRTAHT
jgi:hypothetical protein